MENKEYFGFICRETPASASPSAKPSGAGYVAYVFRCESEAVAGDILKGNLKLWLKLQTDTLNTCWVIPQAV